MSRPGSAASVHSRGLSFSGVLTPSQPAFLNRTAAEQQTVSPASKKRKRDAAKALTTDHLLVAPIILKVRAIVFI